MLERLGDAAADEVRRDHFSLLRQALNQAGGQEVKTLGDGLMVAFTSPVDAVRCAVAIQRAVETNNRARPEQALGVRVGLHVGEPLRTEDDYHGLAVNVAKRLCDRAQAGQILASELVEALAAPRGEFCFRPAGRLVLKGLAQPLAAVSVEWKETPETSSASATLPRSVRPRAPVPRGPRLVGREAELGALEAELARAAAGQFRCVLLVADPGVGKTRLAAELLARHPEVTGLSARAYPLGSTASFGLWAEALDRHLRRLPPEEISELCGGLLDDLAALVRSVAAVRGSAPEREPPRLSLLESLAVVMANLAAREPLVVVLDDVHWADASSWDALRYLADSVADSPVLVLALARPAELGEQQVAAEVLLGLEQDDVLARFPLRLLDRRGIADLAEAVLGRSPPEPLVDWLTTRALGNSLFVLGLLRALLAEGADLNAPTLLSLPESLAERVLARVKLLDDPVRDTLEVLALLGCRVDLGGLLGVTGLPLDALGPVIDTLVRDRLVVEEERGPEVAYEIAHPLIAEMIVQGISAARRRVLHSRVGRALLAAGRLGEAAPHFARSGEVGDPEAVDALRDALRQAEERGAYREALTILSAILELLPAGNGRWLQMADALAWPAEWVVDHRADVHAVPGVPALRAIDAALEGHPEPARRAKVKFRLTSFLDWATGGLEEAEPHCRQALELFKEAKDTRSMLLAANELTWIQGLRGDYAALEAGAAKVVETARSVGERGVELQAMVAQGLGAVWRGRFDAARSAFDDALRVARDMGNVYRLPYNLAAMAMVLGLEGRIGEAWPLLEEGKLVGSAYHEGLLVEWESLVHWLAGDFRAAARSTQEVVAWNPEGLSRRRWKHLAHGVLSLVETGRFPEARSLVAASQTAHGDRPWAFLVEHRRYVEGVLVWREGDSRSGLSAIQRAVTRLLETGAMFQAAFPLVDLAEVAIECGDVATASQAAAQLDECARRLDRDLYRALAGIAAAWAQLAAGRPAEASGAARAAIAILRPLGYRAFLGRALEILGRSLAGSDPSASTDALDEAGVIFDACGATWRRDRVKDQLTQSPLNWP